MNFKIYLSVIFYSIFLFINISAQTINLNGKLTSQPNNIPLPNAIITFYDAADTTNNLGSVTSDANGLFSSILTDVEDVKNTNVSSKLIVSFSGKSNNIISFEISNSKNEKITANIYSLSTGQLINSFDVNKNNFNWDLKNNHGSLVANGTYILEIKAGTEAVSGKLLKIDNYFSVSSNFIKQTNYRNTKLEKSVKINSSIENILMKINAAGHETYDTTFSGQENHELNIDIWKTANYKLEHTINVFNIFGERQKENGPTLNVEFPNGDVENYNPDTNGKIKLLKRFYTELPDSNIIIEQTNPNFLKWQSYIDTSKAKINHIAVSTPKQKIKFNMNQLNNLGEMESYSIQTLITDPRDTTKMIRTDDSWLKTMIGRDRNPSDSGFVSKFTDEGPYKKFDIFIFTYNLGNGKDIHPDTVQIIKDLYKEQLAHDVSPEGKKLIPEYQIYEVYTLTEPKYAEAAQRDWDNTTDFRFNESQGEATTGTRISPDGTKRMRTSYASAMANDSIRIIKGVIAGALTCSQHPDWSQTEKFTLGQFITKPDGSLNDTYKLLHGLSRYLPAGTDYKNN